MTWALVYVSVIWVNFELTALPQFTDDLFPTLAACDL